MHRLTTSLAELSNSEDDLLESLEREDGGGEAAPCFFLLSLSVLTVALNSSVWSITHRASRLARRRERQSREIVERLPFELRIEAATKTPIKAHLNHLADSA